MENDIVEVIERDRAICGHHDLEHFDTHKIELRDFLPRAGMRVGDLDENPSAVGHRRGHIWDQLSRYPLKPDIREFNRALRRDFDGLSVEAKDGCRGKGDATVSSNDLLCAEMECRLPR